MALKGHEFLTFDTNGSQTWKVGYGLRENTPGNLLAQKIFNLENVENRGHEMAKPPCFSFGFGLPRASEQKNVGLVMGKKS